MCAIFVRYWTIFVSEHVRSRVGTRPKAKACVALTLGRSYQSYPHKLRIQTYMLYTLFIIDKTIMNVIKNQS